MKIAFMSFACPTWSLEQILDAAVRHDYHGVEFRTDATHAHGVEVSTLPDERREIRKRLSDSNIQLCCLATSLQFATDRVQDEAPARIQLAHDLGCPALRVFCGKPSEELPMEALVDKVARQLRATAELAHDARVELWLETHDTFSKAADAAAAVRRADHSGIGINYDNMHPFRKGEPVAESFRAMQGLIRHSHFHDSVLDPAQVVIRPLGQGDLPMDEMFAALVATGYDGYLSGEWFHQQYGDDPETSLEHYRRDMQLLADRHGVRLGS